MKKTAILQYKGDLQFFYLIAKSIHLAESVH